jgi:hypothetical protein
MQRNVFVSNRAIEWLQFLETEGRKPEGLKVIRSSGIAIFIRGDEKAKQHANINGMGAVLQAALNGNAERLVFSDFTIIFEGRKLCKLSKPSNFKGRHIKLRNRPCNGKK